MCLAVPGRIVAVSDGASALMRTATVDFGGLSKEVNLAYTPEAQVGDYVLVHVGFAITVVDEQAARQTLEYLNTLTVEQGPLTADEQS